LLIDKTERPSGADRSVEADKLIVDIDGYEGPLDLLLDLARSQKVDLTQISILQLAEQYLGFVETAREIKLELAADYLVMAAWLAYLKSRLLLHDEEGEEPSPEELVERLGFQLRRLEAMRERAAELMSRYRLGRDVFPRGMPEGVTVLRHSTYDLSMYELLSAYAVQRSRVDASELHIRRGPVYGIEDAIKRLEKIVGRVPDWTSLQSFLPAEISNPRLSKSALASTFAAILEVAKQGRVELKQAEAYAPLMLRSASKRRAIES
jgi:segregation and condensation protein A